jgi:UDP-N-acetylglucosamine--N-acetylmuramyl-(pentapeptide) pyrophosphoryl-undecaprenol N-acetylglucosamine transferase
VIGYYVHHHGSGHLHRALAICAHMTEPVVFFSSLARPADIRATDTWVRLPDDLPTTQERPHDTTANDRLHYAPTGIDGLIRRSAELLQVLASKRPRLMVVDVSVEIAVLTRVAGIPLAIVAQPGDRTDVAHRLGYDLADRIIGAWSPQLYQPSWLTPHATRTHMVGAISRFDGKPRPTAPSGRPAGLLLAGAGGNALPAGALSQLRTALPQFEWAAAGGGAPWIDDPWPLLAAADLVVTHGGQNAIADVAVAGAAAIIIPENRPYGEQHAMAAALSRAGVAGVAPRWPDIAGWHALATAACTADRCWELLEVSGAAARAAAVLAA